MNKIIIFLLIFRFIVVYLPLLFFNEWGYEENKAPYDLYNIFQYVGVYLFITISIFSLSFFTNIKQLKSFIYYRAICESFEVIKLLFFMLAIENTIIHVSKLWEWQLGIFINIAVAGYYFYKWKKL